MELVNSALIMAGGQGTRLGYDKKQLALKGKNVIAAQIEVLSALFDELIVSSNTPFQHKNVITVADTLGKGPLAGLYRALSVCKSGCLFVTACDMPFISREYICCLRECAARYTADIYAVQREDGFIEPFNALYHKRILPDIEASLRAGQYRMQPLLKKRAVYTLMPAEIEPFNRQSPQGDIFFNINYPGDLAAAAREAVSNAESSF